LAIFNNHDEETGDDDGVQTLQLFSRKYLHNQRQQQQQPNSVLNKMFTSYFTYFFPQQKRK
jgi:hypothetical protein